MSALVRPVPVSMEPSRLSPILHEMTWAPSHPGERQQTHSSCPSIMSKHHRIMFLTGTMLHI